MQLVSEATKNKGILKVYATPVLIGATFFAIHNIVIHKIAKQPIDKKHLMMSAFNGAMIGAGVVMLSEYLQIRHENRVKK